MQAAGELVILVRELAAGVQLGQDDLDPRHLLLRMDVDRHAAAVVDHRQRLVGVQDHADLRRVTGDRLVDAVVDDFLREVVGAGRIGVHPRPLSHRLEPRQDFDRGGVILVFQG